jgi:hypothetical protein
MKKYINIFTVLVLGSAMFAQQTPAPKQTEAITIVGATAHIGDGTVVENSNIVFENGKIMSIGGSGSRVPWLYCPRKVLRIG